MSVLKIAFPRGAFTEEETESRGFDLALSLCAPDGFVILSPGKEAAASGYAVTTFMYHSPVTGDLTFGYAPLGAGCALRENGIDAVAVTGMARSLSLISIKDRTVVPVPRMRDLGNLQFSGMVKSSPSDTVLSVGRAAMNGVVCSSLRAEGKEINAPGLGTVLARMGVKGLLLPGSEGVKRGKAGRLNRKARQFLEEGERTLLEQDQMLGTLPVRAWSGRRDPRASFFSEKAFKEDFYASYPSYREAALLGTNLGVFNVEEVLELAGRVSEAGIDTAYAGALLAGRSLSHQERLSLLNDAAEGARVPRPLLLSGRGLPFSLDLRGSFPEAIAAAYELPSVLLSSRLMPSRPVGMRAAAELMLYETVYGYGLLSEGYSPEYALCSHWGRFPSSFFSFPSLTTAPLLCAKARLKEGFRILERFERGPYRLPDAFRLRVSEDGRAVNQTLLLGQYAIQKERLRRVLKLKSEKTAMPSGDSNAAVGPDDDLGRDGDPGLRAIIPFLS